MNAERNQETQAIVKMNSWFLNVSVCICGDWKWCQAADTWQIMKWTEYWAKGHGFRVSPFQSHGRSNYIVHQYNFRMFSIWSWSYHFVIVGNSLAHELYGNYFWWLFWAMAHLKLWKFRDKGILWKHWRVRKNWIYGNLIN